MEISQKSRYSFQVVGAQFGAAIMIKLITVQNQFTFASDNRSVE